MRAKNYVHARCVVESYMQKLAHARERNYVHAERPRVIHARNSYAHATSSSLSSKKQSRAEPPHNGSIL